MLRSLHAFRGTHATSLSFEADAMFVDLGSLGSDTHWCFVMDAKANTGFVPRSYVTVDECLSVQETRSHIDKLRLLVRQRSKKGDEKDVRILEKLDRVIVSPDKGTAKPRSSPSASSTTSSSRTKRMAPRPPTTPSTSTTSTSRESLLRHGRELIELIRVETGLSSWSSQSAVHSVVSYLVTHFRHPESELSTLVSLLEQPLIAERDAATHPVAEVRHLESLLESLTLHKEDEQQRNWHLTEDEGCIRNLLEALLHNLQSAPIGVSEHVLSKHKYCYVQNLIEYFQMETRWSLRRLLIDNLQVMCHLDSKIVSLLLNSVLPLELAHLLHVTSSSDHVTSRSEQSCKATQLLTHVFSSAEPMPVNHLDVLGVQFVDQLLHTLENTDDERLANDTTALILSYNLQFNKEQSDEELESNLVISSMTKSGDCKVFVERLLLLLNREEDPVKALCGPGVLGDFEKGHSAFKMAMDMFSRSDCSSLLYTNDLFVLIDIVVRQLTDLGPGDEDRKLAYLRLCQRLLRAAKYEENAHRADDLAKVFRAVVDEEESDDHHGHLVNLQKSVVANMVREFDQVFPHLQ